MITGNLSHNVAVIGVGRWGKNLARNFHQLNSLHTICDTHISMFEQHQNTYPGVNITHDYESVLKNPHIKRIIIAAPAIQHYSLAKKAILAGKDVYVEKPLCMDYKEAEELVQLSEKHGSILMVGHLLQYHPCVKKLHDIVEAQEIGTINYISSNRLNLGAIRVEENALWNFAPHDISVILSLCNHQIPTSVRCMGGAYVSHGVVDKAITALRFPGNLKAHIYVSWLNPFKEQKLVVLGSTGMAVFDDTKPWEDKLTIYRNYLTRKPEAIPETNNTLAEKVEVVYAEPLREECLHFIHCCDTRKTPRTDGHEGLRVLKVLQAAQDSLDEDGESKSF